MHVVTLYGISPDPVGVADVTGSEDISQVSLAIGRLTDSAQVSALLTYVSANRVHIKLFSLTDEPLNVEQIASVEAPAPTEDSIMSEPFAAYHTQRKEWLIAWKHNSNLEEAFGLLRMQADGKIVPASYSTILARTGRLFPHGIHVSPATTDYVFVSYALDDSNPVLLTGLLQCTAAGR